jgi:FlaA1/EpsC-like NDP-sugar epimerase
VVGRKILGVPVRGTFERLLEVVKATRAETVIFLTHGLERELLLRLLTQCRAQGVEFMCFDGAALLNGSAAAADDQRDIELILQRREIPIDVAAVGQLIRGQRILVTGAGGSIGSELCRQIAAYEPGDLYLLERSENNLFFVHRELVRRWPNLRVHPILGDITDEPDLQRIFLAARPQAVFHAAAHKHVGMMERQPHLAIKNNVIGTTYAARAAIAAGAKLFVNISTDKAVKPTSVMGLSKRLAELCVQEISEGAPTRFVIVRFGNVAGSTGSVVQLFRQQIARGEALTVTDRAATRFFMSISEAVRLVLQAAVLGESGRIFVLDTGESVNIYELARTMICLAGYVPDVDIPIKFTGLTGGEKLNEELWDPSEEIEKRLAHDRLIMIRAEERRTSVLQRVAYWRQLVDAGREADLIAELRRVWPNFRYDDLTPAADPAPWPRQGGFHMGLVARAGVVLRNAHRLPREER